MMESKKVSRTTALLRHIRWEHLVAGISGGVVSTLILHPLDLVKIRFQVNEGFGLTKRPEYKGLMHALKTITRTQGVTGLYQGVTPNVWGAGASWGLYFFWYNSIKNWMQGGDPQLALGPLYHILAASEAGFITLIFTNPIWVTKTRICLQYEKLSPSSTPVAAHKYYNGTLDGIIKIYKTEGMRGLYKGFVPGVFGISHGALQFMAYEEMKNKYNVYRNQSVDTRLSSVEYLFFAAVSKMFAASATYPYQVVRSRLQDQHRSYSGVRDVLKQIIRWDGDAESDEANSMSKTHMPSSTACAGFEGMYGFYKGLVPSLLRVTPACCITFLVYENMITMFANNKNGVTLDKK